MSITPDANQQYQSVLERIKNEFLSDTIYHQRALSEIRQKVQQLMATLYDTSSIATYVFDYSAQKPSEYFVYINSATEKLTGLIREELMHTGAQLVMERLKDHEVPKIVEFHESFFRQLHTLPPREALRLKYFTYNSFRKEDGEWIELIGSGQPLSVFVGVAPTLMFCTLQPAIGNFIDIESPQAYIENLSLPSGHLIELPAQHEVSDNITDIINKTIQSHVVELSQYVFDENKEYHPQYRDMLRFMRNLVGHCKELTPMEIKICMLYRQLQNSESIVEILGLSLRTLQNHRNRIRRKLNIPESVPFQQYLTEVL